MLLPSIFSNKNSNRLFDDLFELPDFFRFDDMDKKLYGKNAAHVMKTDVKETENGFAVAIDLPGFKKDEIEVSLDNGYMTIKASKGLDKDEKDKDGKVIRQERYSGSMQRSFYVGEAVTEEDIKAKFEDGVLKLDVPKKEVQVPETKRITIEG